MIKTIEELHEMLKSGEITSDELVKDALKKAHIVENTFVKI